MSLYSNAKVISEEFKNLKEFPKKLYELLSFTARSRFERNYGFNKNIIRVKDNNEKITIIALTNKRLLFMDYIAVDNFEVLRITKGINFPKYKDVYYTINLDEIKIIESINIIKLYFLMILCLNSKIRNYMKLY